MSRSSSEKLTLHGVSECQHGRMRAFCVATFCSRKPVNWETDFCYYSREISLALAARLAAVHQLAALKHEPYLWLLSRMTTANFLDCTGVARMRTVSSIYGVFKLTVATTFWTSMVVRCWSMALVTSSSSSPASRRGPFCSPRQSPARPWPPAHRRRRRRRRVRPFFVLCGCLRIDVRRARRWLEAAPVMFGLLRGRYGTGTVSFGVRLRPGSGSVQQSLCVVALLQACFVGYVGPN